MQDNHFNFDEYIDRSNTHSEKWDGVSHIFKKPNLLPLWVADMDFLAPLPIRKALIKRAKHGIYGYTFFPTEYYTAVINWFKRHHNWDIKKNWITYTPGVIPGINLTIQLFSKSRDKIIIQNPAYPPFFSAVKNNDRRRLLNPLKLSNKYYEIDFEDLEVKAKTPSTRILILCNPHNPTGRVWTKKDLIHLGEICLQNNILVLSDEIHCDLIYPKYKHIPFASISDEFAQNSITCTSPSKTFNLPGLKVSNIIIPNQKLRNIFRQSCQSIGITQANCFGSIALEVAYNNCENWLAEAILYIQKNFDFLKAYLEENLPELEIIEPEGTYFAWIDFRKLGFDPNQLSTIMREKAKVALFEGYLFGKGGKGFNRINLACPRSILERALNQITKAIKDCL